MTVASTPSPAPRRPIDLVRISWAISFSLMDVDEAEAVHDLSADEEVAPQRLLFAQRLVLVDSLDRHLVSDAHRIVREVDRQVAHEDASRGRLEHAGQHLDEGRLAGAVVADEADDLVPADCQVDVLQRVNGTEIFLDRLEPDDVRKVVHGPSRGCGKHKAAADSDKPAIRAQEARMTTFPVTLTPDADAPPYRADPHSRHRVKFKFRVDFVNGGHVEGEDFLLDIEGTDVSAARLAEMIVSALNLLRAGPVTIYRMEVVRRGDHGDL